MTDAHYVDIDISDNLCNFFQDDEEPSDPKYAPDGEYIPRILFIGTKIIFICYFSSCNYSKATWKDTLQHGTIPLVYKI